MHMVRRSQWIGIPIVFLLMVGTPLLIGGGCPGNLIEGIPVRPITTGSDAQIGADGNPIPRFTFVEPVKDKNISVGNIVEISWTDEAFESNARVTLQLDPDNIMDNGNEITILTNRRLDLDGPYDSFSYDTQFLGQAAYRIVAKITDGVNPNQIVIAPGRIVTLGEYIAPQDPSPTIAAESPVENITIGHNDLYAISWRGWDQPGADSDVDDPIVIVLLDFDRDPSNDLNLNDPNILNRLEAICENPPAPPVQVEDDEDEEAAPVSPMATYPQINPRNPTLSGNLDGAYALYCVRNIDQVRPAAASGIVIQHDITQIPPLPDGTPYNIRIMMWDRVNPPVHSYAWGTMNISKTAGPLVDLAQVGKNISGTRFLGFNSEAWLGSTGIALGDFDGDGADDFVLVARYGQPFERGKVGAAYLVYGLPPIERQDGSTIIQKFGGQISINNVDGSTNPNPQFQGYRGTVLAMGQVMSDTSRQGINTDGMVSISQIADVTGDGTPEIIFGFPYIAGLYDYLDDDPCDRVIEEDPFVFPFYYPDSWPNRLSTPPDAGFDDIGSLDEVFDRYITGGYVIITYGDSILNNSVIEVALTGQFDPDHWVCVDEGWCRPGEEVPNGIRYRGYWYDNLNVPPGSFGRIGQFGKTANAIPDMTSGTFTPSRDGYEELLISTPDYIHHSELDTVGRGRISFILGMDFAARLDDPVKSFPRYIPVTSGDECVGRSLVPVDTGREVNIFGERPGDEFGYAGAAGDFNLDGHTDILAGAPGASRRGYTENGIVYIIFGRLDFGNVVLGDIGDSIPADNPPRVEIHGDKNGARLGERQTQISDFNGDGIDDIAIASPYMDSPTAPNTGFVGVIFGGQRMTGENTFMVKEIGTPALQGVRFYGTLNSGAGEYAADAGDFNGDGYNDLLIVAANEMHTFTNADGTPSFRRGVCYLIFGGTNLRNGNEYNLSQVGTPELPGIKFVSPYELATANEAAVLWAGSAGDVNGDGFDDVLLGLPRADYVYPQDNPVQRRKEAGEVYLIYGHNASGLNQ
ncbi:MAG: hypothetical protein GXY44_11380 [Phycisphaerales bacterium]|nr:hypothetical protein [Phycisphaerales bacterium]